MSYYMPCFIDSSHEIEYFDIHIFNDIWITQFNIWIIDTITTSTTFIYFNTVRIEHSSILLIYIIFGLVLHSLFLIETHSKQFTLNTLKLKNVIAAINTFLINPNILYHMPFFSIKYL